MDERERNASVSQPSKLKHQTDHYSNSQIVGLAAFIQSNLTIHHSLMAAKASFDQKGKRPKDKKVTSKRKHQPAEPTPSNKKRALKAERQSHRRHASTVRPAKEIWASLRVKTNDSETNAKLCTELYEMLKGKILEVAMQHDASRMVQAILQFGNK